MNTAVCEDRFGEMFSGRAVAAWELPGRSRAAATEMAGRHDASLGKPEFFGADMYMFHVTGFRPGRGVLTEPVRPARGARLDVWQTDPADRRPVPVPGGGGVLFSTEAFALKNSGNRTLHAPKPSWRIILDAAGQGSRLAGMTRINLKAMYNDPSQMREALAWRLFGLADIPAPRHTYAKLALGTRYRGLFSVIEHVDKKFLRDHFGGNYRGNLYKTGYRDIGGAYLEYRAAPDGDDSGRQYFIPGSAERTYRLQTNKNNPEASTYDDLACFIRTINGIGLGGGEERFDTDAFRESVDGIMNVNAFFRWAAVNMLLGSWDNYYASGSNYYLYNSGQAGSGEGFRQLSLFPLHTVGLRQLPGDRLFRHPVAVRRYPGLAGESEPSQAEDPARPEPAPQPRLPSVLPGLCGAHARYRVQSEGHCRADRAAL